MSAQLITKVIAQLPELTVDGIGYYASAVEAPRTPAERLAYLELRQAELLQDVPGFEAACVWLSKRSKIKTVNKNHTSYGLKHMVERASKTYVANGTFIAAAIHLGFAYKHIPGSLNALFNISEKSIS